MTLHPQAAKLVEAINLRFPKLGTEVHDAALARAILAANPASPLPGREVSRVSEKFIPGAAGDIRVRVYQSSDGAEPGVGMVFFHGGGFVICSLDTHDGLCREIAAELNATVVSVDYRMAPEHRFPAAAQDAYAATCWVAAHAAELGIDTARLVVAGDSAGGNLAAVVALTARDRGGPALAYQVLIYPMTDARCDSDSYRENALGYAVTADHLKWYWSQYLGDQDGNDPLASPLQSADLSGLPPAYIIAAEHCPLLSEDRAYAQRLKRAGTQVTYVEYPGMFHGFFTLPHILDTAKEANIACYRHLNGVLND